MGDQENRLVFSFSLDDPQMAQDRGRTEFAISAGIGVSNSKLGMLFNISQVQVSHSTVAEKL